MEYRDLSSMNSKEIEQLLCSENPAERGAGIIAFALTAHFDEAQEICLCNTESIDPIIRGNSVLGLGHIARIHGKLDKKRAMPVLKKAVMDPDNFVRGQAISSIDDIKHFLKWKFE